MPDRHGFKRDVDHDAIITSIAQEMQYPVPIVRRIYDRQCHPLGVLSAIGSSVGGFSALIGAAARRLTEDTRAEPTGIIKCGPLVPVPCPITKKSARSGLLRAPQ